MKQYLNNRNGGALIVVLLVMMTITILGTTIINISMTENKQAISENNRLEAYYLAKAGVEATVSWLLDPETTTDEINQILNKTSNESVLGNGKFYVQVLKDTVSEDLVVEGTGIVKGTSSSSRMLITKEITSGEIKFDYSVYLMSNTTYKGNVTIDGSLGHPTDVTVLFSGNANITGSIDSVDIEYPVVNIPKPDKVVAITNPSVIDFSEGHNTIEFANGISLSDKNNLEIYTGSGDDEVNLIIDGNFTFGSKNHSDFIIYGDRRINVYVTGNVDIVSNFNSSGSPQKLLFLMDGSNSFNLDTNVEFNGFIYAPEGSFKTQGNAAIKGAIIAKHVELGGTPFAKGYIFSPEDDSIDIPDFQLYSKGTWLD